MIIGKLSDTELCESVHPNLARALQWLQSTDLAALPPGRVEIDGDRLYAIAIQGSATPRAQGKLEIHRRYVDVQYALGAGESFGWRPTAECAQPAGDFDAEKGAGFFLDAPVAWYPLAPETFAIFFPGDAHAPGLGEGDLHKVVVKVLLVA